MGWQEYAVLVIGLVVGGLLVRRMICLLQGRKRGGCASCESTGCPLRKDKKQQS